MPPPVDAGTDRRNGVCTDPTPAAAADAAARPHPAAALERRFATIQRTAMAGVPLLNPVLAVQAVGFAPWSGHWLGVLITPWFMNLVLCPRLPAQWPAVGQRESRHYVFPAGVFEFIGHHDDELGPYQACSLFSPMFEFASPQAAYDTAVAARAALFDEGLRAEVPTGSPKAGAVSIVPPGAATGADGDGTGAATRPTDVADLPGAPKAAPGQAPALSKRDFLFGNTRRSPP